MGRVESVTIAGADAATYAKQKSAVTSARLEDSFIGVNGPTKPAAIAKDLATDARPSSELAWSRRGRRNDRL